MTVVLDSRRFALKDRHQAVHEGIADLKVPVKLATAGSAPRVLAAFTDIGTMRICSLRSNVNRVTRSERMTGDGFEASVFLALQRTGSSVVVQDDREAMLRPGDLVMFDTTASFGLLDDVGIRQWQIRIPVSQLGVPISLLRRVSATALSPGHPVADLAAAYFRRMGASPETFSDKLPAAVNGPSIELIRALINTHVDASAELRESMQQTLPLRIMEFVRSRLGDPTLDAATIATEHHISVRHLYNVLAASDISLGRWIRTERLEGCRADLARSQPGQPTIAAIARRWGFADASTFARHFRAAYGMTPREYRAFPASLVPPSRD
jgi:AraC-like DNA-binding protein